MSYPFTEDHVMLRDTAKRWLAEWRDKGGLEKVGNAGDGADLDAWKEVATELGWSAAAIDECHGGVGLGLMGRVVLMEEMGAALFSAPFFSTCCLAVDHIAAFGSGEQKATFLPAIASGDLTIALADGRTGLKYKNASLSGAVRYIVDGAIANTILTLVSIGESRYLLAAIPADHDGLRLSPQQTMDPTRGWAQAIFENIQLSSEHIIGEGGNVELQAARVASQISLAAENVGGAQRCLDMTVEYVKERVQFGRPIASFQAVKHRCADMMVAVEAARSAVYGAAAASEDDLLEWGLIASAYSGERFFRVAADAIQMHGGIGFSWEYPLHFYFKRARANRSLFGLPSVSYDQLADHIGLLSPAGAL